MRVSVLKGFARHAVRPAVLIFSLVGMAAVSHSQTAATAAQSTTKDAAPAAMPAIAAPTAQPGQPASPSERKPGGNHEGIQVHGHWTIEVRNPDGKVVSHTEFENSLQSGGQQALAAILWGFTPGDWAVFLDGASGDTQLPCTGSLTSGLAPCEIVVPGSNFASNCTGGLPAGLVNSQCFPTLEVGNDVNRNSTNVALAGTLIASNAGVITDVQTFLQLCTPTTTPAACAGGSGVVVESYEFTSATLPAQISGQCGGSGQPECAVTVTAGQSVSVSVTISFQ